MSTHAPCSVCEGVEHHWLPYSDDNFTGYVCKHCPATATGVPDDDEYLTAADEEEISREEYYATHYTCDTCGGEFWDGGTSCTCNPAVIEHGGKTYTVDYEGKAETMWLGDRTNAKVRGGVDYRFQLKGAHEGEPIEVWVTDVRDFWEENGARADYGEILWADDETPVNSELLDFYVYELRDHLDEMVREWE